MDFSDLMYYLKNATVNVFLMDWLWTFIDLGYEWIFVVTLGQFVIICYGSRFNSMILIGIFRSYV